MIEALFALLILPVVSSSAVAEKSKLAQDIQQISGKVDIIGHRGAAGLAPENTLAAFRKACELGVDAVELDVFLTADSTIVVHHDYTLKPEIARTAGGEWLNHILSFDWRALVHIQKIAPDIPTVYLSLVGRGLNNIKPGQPGPSPWMAGYDIDDFQGSIPLSVKASGGQNWAPYYKHLTDDLLKEAHELGLKVYVGTVDSRREMVRLMEMGVDGIINNRPDILKSVVGLP